MATSNSKQIINILIVLVVLVALFLAYIYLIKPKPNSDVTVVQTGAPTVTIEVSLEAQRIIGFLNELNTIKLNKDILSLLSYQSLKNFKVPIPAEATSTPNPFKEIKF